MTKVPKDRVTPEFRAVLSRFEESLNSASMDLVNSLVALGWTQGEAQGFLMDVIKNANFDLPEKGKEEVPDEFLYGQQTEDIN